MDIAQMRFKELRIKLGLTQPQIAEKLGMVTATWQKLEYGKTSDPRASTIVHICKTLNVSADWLMGLTESNDPYAMNDFDRFYSKMIDLACDYEQAGLLSENDTDCLINDINDAKEAILKK